MKKIILIILSVIVFPAMLFAFDEIRIYDVQVERISPDRFALVGQVHNRTPETRELTLRAQVAIYERNVPPGDKPVAIIQRDFIQVLNPWETRDLHLRMMSEGTPPSGALKLEPILRVRRQREWMY